jgi:hypothetical protein
MQHLKQLPVIVDYTGVPIVDYGIINGTYIGLQRNPVVIDHKAQDFYNSYIQKHDLRSKQLFLNNANWLTEHMTRQVFTDNIAYFR